jgi:hypothetical protein
MKTKLSFIFTLFFSLNISAEIVQKKDTLAIQKFIEALKKNDKDVIAELVDYPLARTEPLTTLKNSQEFTKSYDQFFNEKIIQDILKEQKNIWGNWKGTTIGPGYVWFREGKIIAINTKTDLQNHLMAKAKKIEQNNIHESANKYDQLLFECHTRTYKFRIHDNAGKIKLFGWLSEQQMIEAPAINVAAQVDIQGSGGNTVFTAVDSEFKYVLHKTVLCGENCDSDVVFYRNNKKVSSEVCSKINF